MSAGVSKDSNVRTNRIKSTEAVVGMSKRKVTRRKVCHVFAPGHHRRLLQRRIHRFERRDHKQECQRHLPDRVNPNHAGERENTLKGADCKPEEPL